MEMLVSKLQKQSTQAELWERYLAGDPTVDTLGESGKYQYLVDYWVEPRVYAEAPPTGCGEEFEEEDKAIQLQNGQGGFIGMLRMGSDRDQR